MMCFLAMGYGASLQWDKVLPCNGASSLQIQGHDIVIYLQLKEGATQNVLHWDNLFGLSACDMTTKRTVSWACMRKLVK